MRYVYRNFLLLLALLTSHPSAWAQPSCQRVLSAAVAEFSTHWKPEKSTLSLDSREIPFESFREKEINIALPADIQSVDHLLKDLFQNYSAEGRVQIRDAESSALYPPQSMNIDGEIHQVGVYKEIAHHYAIEGVRGAESINVRYKKTYPSDLLFEQSNEGFSKKLLTLKDKQPGDGLFESRLRFCVSILRI
jgi:hypothetical protein